MKKCRARKNHDVTSGWQCGGRSGPIEEVDFSVRQGRSVQIDSRVCGLENWMDSPGRAQRMRTGT